ncbi:MAG: hypothetical protein JXX14_00660 [Deltaproteobacteria bacterium]|nr:hypothetical protein [Deltaproteobacteria bacterium]
MVHHRLRHFRWVIFLYIVLLCHGIPGRGGAVDVENAVVTVHQGCVDVDQSEVDRILGLELQSSAAGGNTSPRPTRLAITCEADAVTIVLNDRRTGELAQRRLALAMRKDNGKERLIALAAVELILPLWERLAAAEREDEVRPGTGLGVQISGDEKAGFAGINDVATVNATSFGKESKSLAKTPVIGRRTASPTRAQKKMRRDNSMPGDTDIGGHKSESGRAVWGGGILFGPTGYVYPAPRLLLIGGELSLNAVRNDRLEMLFGGGAAGGRTVRALGRTALLWANVATMMGIRNRLLSGRLLLRAMLGFRGGYGQLTGKPESTLNRGHRLHGMVGGPAIRLSAFTARRPSIGVSLETGHTIWGLEGYVEGESDITLARWWIMVSLDLGVQFNHTGEAAH